MTVRTIPELVRSAAERYADTEAVVDGRTRVSYAELAARVDRATAACMANGVRVGDRVAIWAPNTLDWIVAALGAVSAGAVLVPLNTRFKGGEAADVLRRSGARLLFVTGAFLGTSYVASLRRALAETEGPGLPALDRVVVLSDDAPADFLTWKDFLASGEGVGEEEVRTRAAVLNGSHASDLIYTSGTTGRPKGVVTTHAQTLRAYATWADLAGLGPGDRYLIVNPLFHTFGYKAGVLACLMRGATMIPQPVFNATATLAHIAKERVTALPGPPTLLESLLDHPERTSYDLTSLRLTVTGAAVIPEALVERLRRDLGMDTVLTAYGLSEATGIVTMCRREDEDTVIATTSGRAIPGTEVRVVDAHGTPVGPGVKGEIQVRGFNVMQGYYEDERATRQALTPDGWLRTGDVGTLDPAGHLRITDRLKDMYIVGGFNAYPAEIEHVLRRHPDITDAAVIGVPDPRLGEVGRAYVVRRRGATTTADDLIAWSRREMANYKVPRSVEFVTELPRNASGKVLKRELRERAGDHPLG
ncbi:FadD3 family acyl-CoA ligase [Streptomyces sp. 15-116A]|uniref:FadD3 family acyl-CoA ligase n=1 Tax=Streptomyces sp. 15-116A TaxID=2259035 RepID=UPI0021B173F3|nr:FadD3 family acyl-CoA ligase [Streptomyces sp. 15-116A]MCT7353246.1 FadD3 family acyl-CoA ligase [Streptomyces sp. 15-116A]